jgi:hypothetical protein
MRKRNIKRSMVYHTIDTIAPINHLLKARNDIMGSVVIIALMVGCLSLMRFLLTQS